MQKQRKPISLEPGLPRCVAPENGDICLEPAIAKVLSKHGVTFLCSKHVELAKKYYEGEPLARREDIEYLTARRRA